MTNKKAALSVAIIKLDAEPVERCICLIIRSRFDKLNDQKVHSEKPIC
ncbi:MAG: hypothetical protein ABR597_10460 [Bacteroidales bacterium]